MWFVSWLSRVRLLLGHGEEREGATGRGRDTKSEGECEVVCGGGLEVSGENL